MYLEVFVIGVLAGMSPGPDFFIVMRNSLGFGRRAGMASAMGIGAALSVHVAYTILGIAIIIQNYVILFKIIQIMGATYLIYLALMTIISSFKKENNESLQKIEYECDKSFSEGFKNGFFCNILNPKAFLFFLSIFSQFITVDTLSWIRWIYGLEVVIAITGWFLFLSLVISSPFFVKIYKSFRKWIDRFLGCVLIYFAVRIYKSALK